MSVCRQTSRVYCDVDDLDGVLNVVARTIKEEELTDHGVDFLAGVFSAFLVLRHQSNVENQAIFMKLLENSYETQYGMPLIKEVE